MVFGGGPVGARKARRFAREARVVVVSPAFCERGFGGAERVRAAPTPADVADWVDRTGPALVIAATDDTTLNDAVARTAHERGILSNRADHSADDEGDESNEATRGHDATLPSRDVVVPATVRDEPVLLAVATGGRSPALSRYLRERFETEFANAGAMADLSGRLRSSLKDRGIDPGTRRAAIRAVVRSEAVWKALGAPGPNAEEEAESVISDVLSAGNDS